jgi:CRISPR/Cas system-associated endonuclease/helicase Cas3
MSDSLNFEARLASFRSTRYPELRASQARVLTGYAAHTGTPDLAIELPTGYGKTLIALLIGDYASNRASPCLPDRQQPAQRPSS